MKNRIKNWVFGHERIMRIKAGLAKGVQMKIDPGNQTQRILGLAEAELGAIFRKWAPESDILVDVGASDGFYGLVFLKLKPDGLAMLFDAAPEFRDVQIANFNANNLRDGYEVYSKYVSDKTSEMTVSLDDLIGRRGLGDKRILIKIDVDGGELLVLKGIRETLTKSRCRLIVETHSKDLEESCMALLMAMGYSTRIIDNAWWRVLIPESRPISHNRWFVAERNQDQPTKSK